MLLATRKRIVFRLRSSHAWSVETNIFGLMWSILYGHFSDKLSCNYLNFTIRAGEITIFVAIGMKLKSCISGVSKKKLRDSTVTFCATLVTWLCPKRESVQHSSSHILSRIMDNSRSRSLLHDRKSSKSRGYSTFDPGGSIDRGILASEDPERSSKRNNPRATTIEEERESLSISWENIDVFVEQPGPSFLKRLCFGTGDNERPTTKQILFNGEWFF